MKALIVTVTTMSVLIINVCCFRYKYPKNAEIINRDLSIINIPNQFDARNKWSRCSATIGRFDLRVHASHHQWAVISASVMSDRMCIHSEGKFTESLSAQELFECAVTSRGGKEEIIGRGRPGEAVRWEPFDFWKENGIVTQKCKSLLNETISNPNPPKICHYTCQDKTLDYRGQKTFSVKTLQSNTNNLDPRQIQVEIMNNGPVMTLMPAGSQAAPNRILHYDRKLESSSWYVYLKIIGWGRSLNRLTWLAIDAHGWCRGGACHLEFGQGGFEKHIYTGVPDKCSTIYPELPFSRSDADNKLMMANKSPMINVLVAHLLLLISFVTMLMVYYRA